MTGQSPPSAPPGPLICPGCGGRNAPGATECDWCGRVFVSPSRRLRLAGWQLVSTALIVVMVGALIALAVLNASRSVPPLRPSPATPLAASSPSPTPAVTPRVTAEVAATPRPTLTPTVPSGLVPAVSLEATEPPPQVARVVNTGGSGVTVRADPGANAPAVGTLREGAEVQLTDQQQTVAARLWREIQDPTRGLRGWVSSDFLQPLP